MKERIKDRNKNAKPFIFYSQIVFNPYNKNPLYKIELNSI